MELIQWKPFDELDRYMENSLLPFRKFNSDMSIDLYEKDNLLVATMSIPGVNTDDLDVTVDDDSLTISGQREEERETDKKDYYSKEIRRGSFSRMIQLPKTVESTKTTADYSDGVLTVKMPLEKGQQEKAMKVEVKKK